MENFIINIGEQFKNIKVYDIMTKVQFEGQISFTL